jgi:DNA polymerase-3 subunit delta'
LNVLFRNVVGQKELKADLIREIKAEKISHAQLFSGRLGFGGLPMALAFTQYLFCENKGVEDSCGQCASCLKIEDLQHPDVHFVFPVVQAINKVSTLFLDSWREQLKQNSYFNLFDWTQIMDSKERKPIIGIEESKDILRKLSLKAYEGGFKVMIIWLPEEMNLESANKLLKILEEPPPNTVFLLVSENPEKLLITIRSRTQMVRIPKINTSELSAFVGHHFKLDKVQADSIASFAEGDLIRALEFINTNTDKDIYRDLFIQMMRVSYKKDVIGMLEWAEKIASEGKERHKLYLVYALHMFRQSLMNNYIGEHFLRVSTEEEKFLRNFAPFISGNNIREFMETFDNAYFHIDRNANSKILFTQLCFQTMRYIHQA